MQTLSALLGFFSIIFVITAVQILFKNNSRWSVKEILQLMIILIVLAGTSYATKKLYVDEKTEANDKQYTQVYLAVKETKNDGFSDLVAIKLQDGMLSKNDFSIIQSSTDIDFYNLDYKKSLNLSDQSITPIQIEPMQEMSINLFTGFAKDILYLGTLMGTIFIICGFFQLKSLPPENTASTLSLKDMKFEFRKMPSKGFCVLGVILLGLSAWLFFMSANEGKNNKKEIDQFFKDNSHVQAVQNLKLKIYANGKISASEVREIIELPNVVGKSDIIKALK